jgi:DNA-binding transcriptional LysR family regulator
MHDEVSWRSSGARGIAGGLAPVPSQRFRPCPAIHTRPAIEKYYHFALSVNPNLRHFEALVAVARAGNFTRAALALRISQPTLTVRIRQMEEALGVRLLDRSTRSVRLTQIGKELAPVMERLVREMEAVVANAKDLSTGDRGIVSIAALPSISSTILPGIIAEFRDLSPAVAVVLKDSVASRILSMVKNEEVDFGIGSFPDADPDIQSVSLFTDRMRLVFPAGSPLEHKKVIPLRLLTDLSLILMDQQSSVRSLVNRAFESIGHVPAPAYEVTYMSTAVGLVKAGLGVAVLPASGLEISKSGGVRSRVLGHPALTRKIAAAQKKGRSLPPASEAFLKLLIARSRSLPADPSAAPDYL